MPRIYPHQLNVIQCPRKFAFEYDPGRVPIPDDQWQRYGRTVHERIEGWQRTGSMPAPESPESRTAALAIPFITPGSFPEIRIQGSWQLADGTRIQLAARVDNLELPDDPAAPVVATDWKTGKPVEDLENDIQFNVTAQCVGQLYGWPVKLRWIYLGRGKKKAVPVERIVYDNTEWMRQHLAAAIETTNDMWQLLGSRTPLEFPMNPAACESRGHRCDYYGLCKMRNRDMPTVAEIKAQHALRLQGNKSINPVEIPKPEDIKASPTATLRAEAEAARSTNTTVPQDAEQVESLDVERRADEEKVELMAAPKRRPGRPRKAAAEPTAQALAANPTGAPEPVKVGQAAPETRSSWTLGDLQRLSEELASHGIMITFSFKEASNG